LLASTLFTTLVAFADLASLSHWELLDAGSQAGGMISPGSDVLESSEVGEDQDQLSIAL
jgi:hypothetical protein